MGAAKQSVDDLRRLLTAPGVSAEADAAGMARMRVSAPAADAVVYVHGAHVTHYQPRGAAPVLFMSAESRFAPGQPIRGGVPIIFPWFGAHAKDATLPAHGVARTREWTLRDARSAGDTVTLRFALDVPPFDLLYMVTVGPSLDLALEVRNASNSPASFEEALHTYLAVSDVRQLRVKGLSGRTFIDKVDGMKRKTQSGPIVITGETDRVYLDTTDAVIVDDVAAARRIMVSKEGSASTVVWNPWVEKAKKMADFGDDEWPRMVCVETANVADNAVSLAPGASHVMSATVRVG